MPSEFRRQPMGAGQALSDFEELRADMAAIADEMRRQADQSIELRKGLIAVWRLQNELVERFARLESRLDASTAPAAPMSQAPAPRGPAQPTLPAHAAAVVTPPATTPPKPSPEAVAAWRELADALALEAPDALLDKIGASMRRQVACSSADEAFVRAAFSLLPRGPTGPGVAAPLEAFVRALLGAEARLISPRRGDPFDRSRHEDHSTHASGDRNEVRELLLPGVRCGDRLVTRAIIST